MATTTFTDFVQHYLTTWFRGLHAEKPQLTWREYLAAFTDALTTAASDLAGKATHLAPGFGVEVNVASDYDPATGLISAELHLQMVGLPAYEASTLLLSHGLLFRVDEQAFTTNVTVPMDSLRKLR